MFTAITLVGEGNGTPLQYTCLENPMDGGAQWAAVHGVARSWTQLSDFTFTFPSMHWRRKWQPTPVFLPGESQGRGSLVGCRLWGHTESDTTEAAQQQQQPVCIPFICIYLCRQTHRHIYVCVFPFYTDGCTLLCALTPFEPCNIVGEQPIPLCIDLFHF